MYTINHNDRHIVGIVMIFLITSLIFMGFWAYIMLMANPSPPQIQYYYVRGNK